MISMRSKYRVVAGGLVACALGCVAILLGDHHVELPFKVLVATGVALVLAGLFLLRYSWTIHERR
ncbi:MAG: hypothetical protein ABI843_02640 [Dokdonella sp.]